LKSKAFQKLVLQDTIGSRVTIQTEGEINDTFLAKMGTAHTALRPMGQVKIAGKLYQAKTYGEFVDQGHAIEIIALENQYLIVKSTA
jgi:membrane-bound ClpP family serine protease